MFCDQCGEKIPNVAAREMEAYNERGKQKILQNFCSRSCSDKWDRRIAKEK
jgi:hypothetical protein